MSEKRGFEDAQIINHNTAAAQSFPRAEQVFVKAAGVLEVKFAGAGGAVVNYGTLSAGTLLDISIRQTTTATTADIIVHR